LVNCAGHHAFKKYAQVGNSSNLSGAEAAATMLQESGIRIVSSEEAERSKEGSGVVAIESVGGFLTDHYDPRSRVLRLSPQVYSGRSLSSVGVACHEAGHALQHAHGYAPLALRSAMVPVATFGSNAAFPLILVGLILPAFKFLAVLGLLMFAAAVLFTIVTLPVEFNATSRAKAALLNTGIIRGPGEREGVANVLNAAALTYVAAAAAALGNLIYYAVLIFGGRRD
jgi:Zn-dependent membrane protease YugP